MTRFLNITVVVLCCLALLVIGEWYTSRGKLPPSSVTNLSGYLAWRPDADQFVRLPNARLLVIGPRAGLHPSGPSAIVFDSTGDILDSTGDLGDNPAFNARWSVPYPLQIEGKSEIASQVSMTRG